MTRYLATFRPQAWINDDAVDVDPVGETTWDCTQFAVENRDYVEQVFTTNLSDAGRRVRPAEVIDREDLFQGDPAAPEWVRVWDGPFTIHIEEIT